MNYRILTVNREFGSGGGRIAQTIAKRLGWKLLDRDIIDAIAYAAHVDPGQVVHYDEHVESWLHRFNQHAMRGAALAAGFKLTEGSFFNADEMVKITEKVVNEAWSAGNCVIVGRGAQCILQNRKDVYHVFVYAPYRERISRLRQRLDPGVHVAQRLRKVDEERTRYLQQYFGECWNNPHLYDLMISSSGDEDATAEKIMFAAMGHVPEMAGATV